jgi:hypothetical protein
MVRRRVRLNRLLRKRWIFAAVASALALGMVPAALADDVNTASTIVQAQLAFLKQQTVLNKCLAASPTKNTPCIRRNSLKLAKLAVIHIGLVKAALDGTERACVATVAQQEITYLRIWRDGARALARNERKKARRLFLSSLAVGDAQGQIQPECFAEVFAGGP